MQILEELLFDTVFASDMWDTYRDGSPLRKLFPHPPHPRRQWHKADGRQSDSLGDGVMQGTMICGAEIIKLDRS